MTEELIPIVQRAYDFAVDLHGAVNRFPRAQKPLLGRELIGLALRLLLTLVTANRRRDKVPDLEEASGTVDALRIALRLSTRLSLLSHKGYEGLSMELDEIGRMLGGWLKQSAMASADTPEARPAVPDAPAKRPRAPVRYRMTSPQVERYLRAKLGHAQDIVFVKSGVFLQTFFDDAVECGKRLGLAVRDLAAADEPERIPACGVPVTALEKYRTLLGSGGRTMRVEE
jgi:hypothetical protein